MLLAKEAMKQLLKDFEWRFEDDAIDTIMDEWSTNKGWLIEAFKNHPNYVDGKFLIAADHTFTRVTDPDVATEFSTYIRSLVWDGYVIDELGLDEYQDGLPRDLYKFIESCMLRFMMGNIEDDFYEMCKNEVPGAHIGRGMKVSRALNKLFTYLGLSNHSQYNARFAKFADAINPLTVVKHTILSINPVDFLTMSFGNSWSSCHTIDTRNHRQMENGYHGMYCSGTMSYMLDGVSMVLYTVDASYEGDEYYLEPKTSRQMFHFHDGKLIQARPYPSYDESVMLGNREFVQSVLAECFGFPNMWVKKSTSHFNSIIQSHGTHYRDYFSFRDSCTFSVIKDYDFDYPLTNSGTFHIGHNPICIQCGREHRGEDSINCCVGHNFAVCSSCGNYIEREEDAVLYEGNYYHRRCLVRCEHCGEYVPASEICRVHGGSRYCRNCLSELGYERCDDCGKWKKQKMSRLENLSRNVCDTCLKSEYIQCRECGNYHKIWSISSFGDSRIPICGGCLDTIIEDRFTVVDVDLA